MFPLVTQRLGPRDRRNSRPGLLRAYLETGRGEIYPYDEWADGVWRRARQGEDFDVKVASFRGTLYNWARRWDAKIHFDTPVDGISLDFMIEPLGEWQRATRWCWYYNPQEVTGRFTPRTTDIPIFCPPGDPNRERDEEIWLKVRAWAHENGMDYWNRQP
jgi:hypothetical protein